MSVTNPHIILLSLGMFLMLAGVGAAVVMLVWKQIEGDDDG